MDTIKIISNGSKRLGESPDTIDELIKVLNEHDIDIARFGAFGFVKFEGDNGYSSRDYHMHNVSIHGNFREVSHVFHLEGVYEALDPVINAIEANLERQQRRIADYRQKEGV